MARDFKEIDSQLQDSYWAFIKLRSSEYCVKHLTGRLVIDFQKGDINSIQDQQIISGVSVTNYALGKMALTGISVNSTL